MSFHDSFHVGWPSIFRGNQSAWRFVKSLRNLNFFDFITKNLFAKFAKSFEWSFLFFKDFLFFFSLVKFESLFGGVSKFVSIEVLELLKNILINWVNHVDDFIVSLSQGFNEWRSGTGSSWLSSNNINIFLSFFHSCNVIFQTNHIFSRFWGVIS